MNLLEMAYRFLWRASRNALCAVPAGRRWLYPDRALATRFGRGDAEYAWRVFHSHLRKLHRAGFTHASRVLEPGPGRNLGTALLWWAYLRARGCGDVSVVCWDVFPNADRRDADYWREMARALLDNWPEASDLLGPAEREMHAALAETVQAGSPTIEYVVCPLRSLTASTTVKSFDLVYSQAVIEHIWFVDEFWEAMARITASDGWHSHRIDLADHGRRATNYLEMCQWPDWSYWATQRFIPGALNRWRASHHLAKVTAEGLQICSRDADVRDAIPVPRNRLAARFRDLDDVDLRTTGLDLVARKVAS
ncbi:MAG: class I SAM-dependent methyltransferase [Nitrospira sp.]|nr:class I SAM-dependent methyltransferase [Nitrospira sp.]